MTATAAAGPFRTRLLREAGGEFAVAATYAFAYACSAWLPDSVLLALVVGVGMQFFLLTMVVGAITPRGVRGIVLSAAGHVAIFVLLLVVASAGGRREPDLLAVLGAQAPLLLRSLARRWRPHDEPPVMWLEMLGPFFLLMPVMLVAAALAWVLPGIGPESRFITIDPFVPMRDDQTRFVLVAGAVYFAMYGVARTAWESLGGDTHRRASLDPDEIRRWREDYRRARRR